MTASRAFWSRNSTRRWDSISSSKIALAAPRGPAAPGRTALAGCREHQRRVLSHRGRRCAKNARHSRRASRRARAIRKRSAYPLRGRCTSLRRSRTQKSPAGIRRRRPRSPRRRGVPIHESSQERRCAGIQSGALLPLRRRFREGSSRSDETNRVHPDLRTEAGRTRTVDC